MRIVCHVGGVFSDGESVFFAKSYLLQISCAMLDHFEMHMCHPPYVLVRLLTPGLRADIRQGIVADFRKRPLACMSLFCRRLRVRFPTYRALMRDGLSVVRAWADSVIVAVDFCERSHAQMRQDLKSEVRARSFTRSANRSVCQQLRVAHVQKGGEDPLRSAKSFSTSMPAKGVPHGSSHGGNPRLTWQNQRLADLKGRFAPDRPLTSGELDDFRQRCASDWRALTDDERRCWHMVWSAQVLERSTAIGAACLADAPASSAPFVPWCDAGGVVHPIPLEDVQSLHSELPYDARKKIASHDPALFVNKAARRMAAMPKDDHCWHGIQGCCASKRNVCRHAMAPELLWGFDSLTQMLRQWCDGLKKDVVSKSSTLVCFRGLDFTNGRRRDVCALLVFARYSPKMQLFARCRVEPTGDDDPGREVLPDTFPFLVSLQVGAARLSSAFRAVSCCTSDELCKELSTEAMS